MSQEPKVMSLNVSFLANKKTTQGVMIHLTKSAIIEFSVSQVIC